MRNNTVTETYDSLFDMGEKDVLILIDMANYSKLSNELKNTDIVYHTSMAAEKFLKGYLIKNNFEVQKIHDITFLRDQASNADAKFNELIEECNYINRFGAMVKYNNSVKIAEDTVVNAIKYLEKIYNFELIKKIRKELREKHENFPSKSDIIFDISNYDISPIIAVKNAVDNLKGPIS